MFGLMHFDLFVCAEVIWWLHDKTRGNILHQINLCLRNYPQNGEDASVSHIVVDFELRM
jgi:hypothetical protein